MLHTLFFSFALNWNDWVAQLRGITLDDVQHLLERYSELGPLPGILLPLLEAFLPILPLVVFIVANATAYGLWAGFLYSWIGVSLGAILVFLLARRLGGRLGPRLRRRFPQTERFFGWIERRGFTPVFILACFPFSPSVIVNIASGLSNIPLHSFLTAVLLGKAVMIFTLSLLGHDLRAIADEPWRLILSLVVLFLLWYGGRRLEKRFT